jgi:hypothetical protein
MTRDFLPWIRYTRQTFDFNSDIHKSIGYLRSPAAIAAGLLFFFFIAQAVEVGRPRVRECWRRS